MSVYEYDTLAYHAKERPGTMLRSLAHVPLKDFGKAVQASLKKVGDAVKPEREAITFYLLNHAVHEVALRREPDEPLGDMLPVVEQYHHALNNLGYRLLNYLMMIVTREMRHLSSDPSSLKEKHGQECIDLTKVIKTRAQNMLWETNTTITVGAYLDFLLDAYNTLQWGGSLGGKKWGVVTQCLHACVFGKTSIEMMIDVGYTLEHNTCSIFNKGFHYTNYSSTLQKILDVQRGGQIPNLVKSGAVSEVEAGHQALLTMCEKAIPGFNVTPWVNWALVEKLGANHAYSQEKLKTEQAHGHLPDYQIEQQEILKQVAQVKEAAAAKHAAEQGMYIEIMPGVKLKKGVMARG